VRARDAAAALALGVWALVRETPAATAATVVQEARPGVLRTEHLRVRYPERAVNELRAFLSYAEEVYVAVDSLLGGALPAPLDVTLARGVGGRSSREGVVLGVEHAPFARARFARELAHAAAWNLLGDAYGLPGYRFVVEGVAAWAEERYERAAGRPKPRRLWAGYAYMQDAAYLEYLAAFDEAVAELGRDVVVAVGHSFVSRLVERRGTAGLLSLLRAMSESADVCSALDVADIGCADFVADWREALAAEAVKHHFATVPDLFADLEARGEGEFRDLDLRVFIRNPETTSYLFFVSYVIDGERTEESYVADGVEFEALVPLGRVPVGAKVMWEVAVWSRTLRTWKKSGWQDRTVR
jgi:hypothetical protein